MIITLDSGELDVEQKRRLVEGFTSVLCSITGVPAQHVNVVIRENQPVNVGVQGVL